jgi:hypothetical protein
MRSRKIVHLPNAVQSQINGANIDEIICNRLFVFAVGYFLSNETKLNIEKNTLTSKYIVLYKTLM